MIQSIMGGSSCSSEEYATCGDFNCAACEEHWLNSLNNNPDSNTGDKPDSDTGDTEEVNYDLLTPPPK